MYKFQIMTTTKIHKGWIWLFIVGFVGGYFFHRFISKQIEFVIYDNGHLVIQDYAYHIIITKAFWFDGFGNIYDVTFQQKALSSYVGSHINTVMPLGITPLALFIWFPFAYVARFNMALSYTFWTFFSIATLLVGLWNLARHVLESNKMDLLSALFLLTVLFSALTCLAVYIGQTSIIATGLLICLICHVHKNSEGSKQRNRIFIPILIFLMGIKPPYIAIGLGLLAIYGMWLQILISLVAVGIALVLATPMLTFDWVPSYLGLLRMYSIGEIPDVYAWSIKPHTMNIFRSAFRPFFADKVLSLISSFVIYSVYICVVGFSILTQKRYIISERFTSFRLSKGFLFVLLIGSYLLFAPYANVYEDVLLIVIFATVIIYGKCTRLLNYKSLVLFIILNSILYHKFFPQDKPLWLFWVFKAVIIVYTINCCRFQDNIKESSGKPYDDGMSTPK